MNILEYLAGWSRKCKDVSPAARQGADRGDPRYAGLHDSRRRGSRSRNGQTGLWHESQRRRQYRDRQGDRFTRCGSADKRDGGARLDYDDTFRPLIGHASAVLVPALLAAAGAAWLLGLNEEGILQAMCLAVSMAAGVKGQFGTAAKPLHAGLAARNSVEAAAIAGAGRPWPASTTASDERHVIETLGLLPKRHPCYASTHNAIDMLFDLKAAHDFTAEDVMLLDCLVGSINQNNLPYAEPTNEMQARFSTSCCLAVTLANNRLCLADFDRERIFDPAIRCLLQVTKMHAGRPAEEDSSGYMTHRLSVHLLDCRTLHAARAMAKDGLADSFSADDRREKFIDCCDGA